MAVDDAAVGAEALRLGALLAYGAILTFPRVDVVSLVAGFWLLLAAYLERAEVVNADAEHGRQICEYGVISRRDMKRTVER